MLKKLLQHPLLLFWGQGPEGVEVSEWAVDFGDEGHGEALVLLYFKMMQIAFGLMPLV